MSGRAITAPEWMLYTRPWASTPAHTTAAATHRTARLRPPIAPTSIATLIAASRQAIGKIGSR